MRLGMRPVSKKIHKTRVTSHVGGRTDRFSVNGLFFGAFLGFLFGADLVIPHERADLGVIQVLAICVILKRAFWVFL